MSSLLWRGLLAGLIAGVLAAVFSALAGEPPLERALQFEAAHASAPSGEEETVSREVQRGAGLYAANTIFGMALGGMFSLVFALAYGRFGPSDPQTLSALLAALGFAALALAPELKYPANPPAVGTAETIGARTAVYFAFLAISLLSMVLAATLAPSLMARLGPWKGAVLSAAIYILVTGAAAFALPPAAEVPEGFPAGVLWNFRMASLGARAVLWAGTGLVFGALAGDWQKRNLRRA
ncbi:MAG TPA: CbtA family protein [Methylocella sp.]|nr:CbtA family protein [Methylocella sp.]